MKGCNHCKKAEQCYPVFDLRNCPGWGKRDQPIPIPGLNMYDREGKPVIIDGLSSRAHPS
jgi:hypothetical protein